MAVTKQTYTISPTWTASQLRSAFRSAFIDAGLMTEWYDSFTNGAYEHGILEIVYNGAKVYGKCYYWFVFTTTGIYWTVTTAWNNSTHVPTGTQYLDYYSTATNTTTGFNGIATGLSTTQTLSLVRYTSAIDTAFSFFRLVNNAVRWSFMIQPGSHPVPSWVNLDYEHWSCLISQGWSVNNYYSLCTHVGYGGTRRHAMCNATIDTATSSGRYSNVGTKVNHICIEVSGLATGESAYQNTYDCTTYNYSIGNNGQTSTSGPYACFRMVRASSSVNPALPGTINPVFTGAPYSMYLSTALPADFGFAGIVNVTTQTPGQTLQVSAGTEEWEIVSCTNSSANDSVTAKGLFLARVI